MAYQAVVRNIAGFSLTKKRRTLFPFSVRSGTNLTYVKLLKDVTVRTNFVFNTGGRKKALYLGILFAPKPKRIILAYRLPVPFNTQRYPVFTPFRRHLGALGIKVASFPVVGPTGTGMNVQHYLGLSLLQLGGMKF